MTAPTLEFNALLRAISTLKGIRDGSQHSGQWQDSSSIECGKDAPGATWQEFSTTEKARWTRSVAIDADSTLTIIREMALKSTAPNAATILAALECPA